MDNQITAKLVTDSLTEQVHVVMPQHLNGGNRLFGGQLMLWIDEVAGIVAIRHAQTPVTTAAIDNLQFRQPVFQNELLVLRGKITFAGNTSLEVRVDSFVEAASGERRLINTAFAIFVSLDEHGKPRKVPQLQLQNAIEEAEFEAGKRRREIRKSLREDLYQ